MSAKKKATQQEIKRAAIAARIAKQLFTAGDGTRATRLVLLDAAGRDLGGWGEAPVRDVVERELRNWLLARAPRKRRKAS